jgi:hypothetical protein
MLRGIAVAIIVAGICSSAFAVDRVSASEKGSVLVYPNVEVRWDAAGNLMQDTFISINNDYTDDVHVVMYFVTETCTVDYHDFDLTKNEAAYWSAATGNPKGVGPFNALVDPWPDPEGCPAMIVRGFIVAFATNDQNEQIRWNHLYGAATVVGYMPMYAWEYNAYAYQAVDPWINGEVVGTAGVINFDGVEYEMCFDTLIMDFYASNYGAVVPTAFGDSILVDTDLTLVIADFDLTQGGLPYTTKADFWIWNENEHSYRNHYCITKWDQSLLSSHGGHFLIENLQTNKGRARIEGISNAECPDSIAKPLLGVQAKYLFFATPGICAPAATAGSNLWGSGTEAGQLLYDVTPGPGEKAAGFEMMEPRPVQKAQVR